MRMLVAEFNTSMRELKLTATCDQTGKAANFAFRHRIANSIVNSSWMFSRRRGRWQIRNTMIKPMKMAAKLSSFLLRLSFTVTWRLMGGGRGVVVVVAAADCFRGFTTVVTGAWPPPPPPPPPPPSPASARALRSSISIVSSSSWTITTCGDCNGICGDGSSLLVRFPFFFGRQRFCCRTSFLSLPLRRKVGTWKLATNVFSVTRHLDLVLSGIFFVSPHFASICSTFCLTWTWSYDVFVLSQDALGLISVDDWSVPVEFDSSLTVMIDFLKTDFPTSLKALLACSTGSSSKGFTLFWRQI